MLLMAAPQTLMPHPTMCTAACWVGPECEEAPPSNMAARCGALQGAVGSAEITANKGDVRSPTYRSGH
jgi:hypothetical protein